MRNALMVWIMRLVLLLLLVACSTTAPTAPPSPQPPIVSDDEAFCPPPANWYVYVTQPGDTLQSLAERTSSTVMRLETANCLVNPRGLVAGKAFYLPRKPITP